MIQLMLKKIGIFSVYFVCLSSSLIAQSYKQYLEMVNKATQEEDYYNAVLYIQSALKFEISTDSLKYLAAENARKLNAFSLAESYYRDLVNNNADELHPDIYFHLGDMQYKQAKYNDAISSFGKYLQVAENEDMRSLTKSKIASSQWAKTNQNLKNPLLKIQEIKSKINTEQNETSPYVFKNSLYITTMRYDERDKNSVPLKKASRILKFNESNYNSEDPEKLLFDENANLAHISFNPQGDRVFYTQCAYIEGTTKLSCAIYTKVKSAGVWSNAKRLPLNVNAPNSNNTQPHVVLDESSGKLRLYFVSDRAQGKGGTDIYYVTFDDENNVSAPINVEQINTVANEYTPFYNKRRNLFYFSSDGHPGFGGQDIFSIEYLKDSAKVINLGASINTSYDDLYFSIDSSARNAYFSSNRSGSAYVDELWKACCFDVYKANFIPATIDLAVNTLDSYDSLGINGATVIVQEIDPKNEVIFSNTNNNASNYELKITEDKKYRIIASKPGYLPDTIVFNTIDPKDYSKIVKNLYLTQEKKLNVSVFEKTTLFSLKGVKLQVWDHALNQFVSELTKLDTNNFEFTILKGKEYQIIASKNKYESDTLNITPKETAAEPILYRKMYLELNAIAELRKLLPIRLFFDNDSPNPKSESDTTNVLFSNIYRDYLNKKGVYMYEFTNSLMEPQRSNALLDIDTFFEHNVRLNAEKLNLFMDKLMIIMEEGHSIDIFLKGYASPRAKSEYNQHLSSRRVTSIRNEFDRYNNGGFHTFIENLNLKIKEIPFGESQASLDVSDSIEDVRNSVYSLKAAYERRVEILEILKGVDSNLNY